MNANDDRIQLIKHRLQQAFSPVYLQVIDESKQHRGHAGYGDGARHFAIVITANCFAHSSLVDAHRQIYALFADMIPEKIHALRINIHRGSFRDRPQWR